METKGRWGREKGSDCCCVDIVLNENGIGGYCWDLRGIVTSQR